jgi:DNA (cytosine-5)-methyltransferase 1
MATGQASAMSAPTIDMAPTLSCNHEAPILMRMREGTEGGGKGPLVSEDQSLTLATGNDQVLAFAQNTRDEVRLQGDGDICGTLAAEPGMKQTTYLATAGTLRANQGSGFRSNGTPVEGLAFHGMQVRRLTPVECCRLQGFPDDYLDITYRGKPAADGNKYKALGNSWAVPVVRWIGKQIDQVRNARLNG